MYEAVEIRPVVVRMVGTEVSGTTNGCRIEARAAETGRHGSQRENVATVAKAGTSEDGREANGGEAHGREVKAHDREDSVDPHIALTSLDESPNLLCGLCLQVLLPLLFPATPQPERLTIGLEDTRLVPILPTLLARLGGYPGHVEVERFGEGLVVRRHMAGGGSETYTVGRSGDLVRVPDRRPVGGSQVKET